jgi:phosphocarrier protein
MCPEGGEARASLEIKNDLGMHLRVAKRFVETVERFDAEVTITKDEQAVNGRSIMGVMMLAAEQGSRIEVVTRGRQAAEALAAIRDLTEARFLDDPYVFWAEIGIAAHLLTEANPRGNT